MRTVYFVSIEDPFEAEAMFDKNGDLLGCWFCDDATWRGEYFAGFMRLLGVEVKRPPKLARAELVKKLRAELGGL